MPLYQNMRFNRTVSFILLHGIIYIHKHTEFKTIGFKIKRYFVKNDNGKYLVNEAVFRKMLYLIFPLF